MNTLQLSIYRRWDKFHFDIINTLYVLLFLKYLYHLLLHVLAHFCIMLKKIKVWKKTECSYIEGEEIFSISSSIIMVFVIFKASS